MPTLLANTSGVRLPDTYFMRDNIIAGSSFACICVRTATFETHLPLAETT
jgi:hypothetical protein